MNQQLSHKKYCIVKILFTAVDTVEDTLFCLYYTNYIRYLQQQFFIIKQKY